jgi:hypothetical protein
MCTKNKKNQKALESPILLYYLYNVPYIWYSKNIYGTQLFIYTNVNNLFVPKNQKYFKIKKIKKYFSTEHYIEDVLGTLSAFISPSFALVLTSLTD